MRPAKIQINLRVGTFYAESSVGTFRITKDTKILNVDNEDYPDGADSQADLSFCRAHISDGTFFLTLRSFFPSCHHENIYIILIHFI